MCGRAEGRRGVAKQLGGFAFGDKASTALPYLATEVGVMLYVRPLLK
jgi:hypothetical protein